MTKWPTFKSNGSSRSWRIWPQLLAAMYWIYSIDLEMALMKPVDVLYFAIMGSYRKMREVWSISSIFFTQHSVQLKRNNSSHRNVLRSTDRWTSNVLRFYMDFASDWSLRTAVAHRAINVCIDRSVVVRTAYNWNLGHKWRNIPSLLAAETRDLVSLKLIWIDVFLRTRCSWKCRVYRDGRPSS